MQLKTEIISNLDLCTKDTKAAMQRLNSEYSHNNRTDTLNPRSSGTSSQQPKKIHNIEIWEGLGKAISSNPYKVIDPKNDEN